MDNPLLSMEGLPPFSRIRPEHAEPAMDQLLAENRRRIEELLERGRPYSWESLIEPIELMEDRLSRAWSPISHMNSVVNGEELRQAYNDCLPKLSEYATELGQNEQLFAAYRELAEGQSELDRAQRKLLENALQDFHLSGVDLPAEKKSRFKELSQELSRLSSSYEENLLDATHAWSKQISNPEELEGLLRHLPRQ